MYKAIREILLYLMIILHIFNFFLLLIYDYPDDRNSHWEYTGLFWYKEVEDASWLSDDS